MNKIKTLIALVLLVSFSLSAQEKYLTRSGSISFEASMPSFEEVAAKNNSATAIINIENGEFASLVLIKGFRFKNALMEEHFNENYAESDKYPKSTFKGVIKDFNYGQLSNTPKSFSLSGDLEFHGVQSSIKNVEIILSKVEDAILMEGSFIIPAMDFNIKIPSIVRSKVSEDVKVDFKFKLEQ